MTNKCNNMRSLTALCKGLAKAKFKYNIEFVSFYNIYWKLPLLHNDRERGRQEYNKSIYSEGEKAIFLGVWFVTKLCALWPKPVALPFARECEDIWGPSNGSPNGLRGNLSSEHERISGALRKSEFSMRLLR